MSGWSGTASQKCPVIRARRTIPTKGYSPGRWRVFFDVQAGAGCQFWALGAAVAPVQAESERLRGLMRHSSTRLPDVAPTATETGQVPLSGEGEGRDRPRKATHEPLWGFLQEKSCIRNSAQIWSFHRGATYINQLNAGDKNTPLKLLKTITVVKVYRITHLI